MKSCMRQTLPRKHQQGALILVTMLILVIVTILGTSSMDSTGLEMQMSSNSRTQQQAFEAAEYVLSWVENDLATSGYFTNESLANDTADCGAVCFEPTCSNGYCYDGISPNNTTNCKLDAPTTEPYETEAIWTNAGFHKTLAIPNSTATAKYIIEYRCFTARDPLLPFSATNSARMFRITAYVVGEGGRSRAMIRSTIKEI